MFVHHLERLASWCLANHKLDKFSVFLIMILNKYHFCGSTANWMDQNRPRFMYLMPLFATRWCCAQKKFGLFTLVIVAIRTPRDKRSSAACRLEYQSAARQPRHAPSHFLPLPRRWANLKGWEELVLGESKLLGGNLRCIINLLDTPSIAHRW